MYDYAKVQNKLLVNVYSGFLYSNHQHLRANSLKVRRGGWVRWGGGVKSWGGGIVSLSLSICIKVSVEV